MSGQRKNDLKIHITLGSRSYCALVWLLMGLSAVDAEEFRFERKADWDSWTFPVGALARDENGSISLSRKEKSINAVANAREYAHAIKASKQPIPGGIRVVGSGEETADNIIDQRIDTWWQPSAEDRLGFWWIEVDLGRMVLATKIRLTFADTLGVKPFRNFSVYTNDGVRATAAKDVFRFTRIGRTTEPNEERVVEYVLETTWPGAAVGDHLATGDTLAHHMVQYVRFVAEEFQPDGALAEIEVETVGDNVVLGIIERGGGVRGGTDLGNLMTLADGDKNTKWTTSGSGDWVSEGHWFEMDMGATYWVDRAFLNLTGGRFSFEINTSDGALASGLTRDRTRSSFDYQRLTLVDNTASPVQTVFDFGFAPRKVRYVFLNSAKEEYRLLNSITELMFFGEGYLAEAVMESGFIDLGGTKSIRRLTWDAELPPDTYVEIRSQTGDTFLIEKKYYNKNGLEVSENQWQKLPKSQKRPIVEIQRRGSDWSGWSQVYADPDGLFLSPSPRKFVQLQIKLGNDNPEVAPTLRSIALHFDAALISGGVASRILPRRVGFDSLQTFRYVLMPKYRSGDQGFDQVQIQTPAPVEAVAVTIGGDPVIPLAVSIVGDLLQVDLPEKVQRDSVEVQFRTRIKTNATAFDGWVGVAGEQLRQGVQPQAQHAATIFVPSVARGGTMIRQLEVSKTVSPNGDGVNDEGVVRFALAKIENTEPEVSIYDLSGQRVRVLVAGNDGYRWDGRDGAGRVLPPGAYICQIKLAADVGDEREHRLVSLAY